MINLDSVLKSRDITLPAKFCIVRAMVFPVVIYWCISRTIKKSWVLKNRCFWIVVLENMFESPLNCKEVQPVNPEGNKPWIFIRRTDTEAEVPVLLAMWCKEQTRWKRPWCWERLKANGEEGDRHWDGYIALLTQWPWIWTNSGRQWRTGKPGML